MADNKKLPIIAGLGVLALLMFGGKKASASSSQPPVEDTQDQIPDNTDDDKPNTDIPKNPPKQNVNVGPVTALEKSNASIVIQEASTLSNIFPAPYNSKKQETSDLDWATNLTFWSTYSTDLSYCAKYADIGCTSPHEGSLVPFKLTQDMALVDGKGYSYWSKVWIRIRNYLKSQYNLK